MPLHDLHGAIDQTITLGHEGPKRVGSQPPAETLWNIGGAIAGFEQFESELGVLGDAPGAPAAHLLQRVAPHQMNGAKLNYDSVLVTLDHAYVEKAAILL